MNASVHGHGVSLCCLAAVPQCSGARAHPCSAAASSGVVCGFLGDTRPVSESACLAAPSARCVSSRQARDACVRGTLKTPFRRARRMRSCSSSLGSVAYRASLHARVFVTRRSVGDQVAGRLCTRCQCKRCASAATAAATHSIKVCRRQERRRLATIARQRRIGRF